MATDLVAFPYKSMLLGPHGGLSMRATWMLRDGVPCLFAQAVTVLIEELDVLGVVICTTMIDTRTDVGTDLRLGAVSDFVFQVS